MKHANAKQPDSWYSRLFAKLYNPVMTRVEERLLMHMRQSLLRKARGRVLEVGAGTGVNFSLYPKGTAILAIEPSQAMASRARQALQQVQTPDIRLLEAGVGDAAVDDQLKAKGVDTIVATLVLCTIPDLEQALRDFQRWLRPGGQLLVLEHIHDDRQPQRWLQSALAPAWKRLAEGCCLNRPTDQLLREEGFRPVSEDYHYTPWVPFYTAVLEKEPKNG